MKIKIRNLEISYSIIGEGQPLLIFHGWGSKKERWQEVAKILSQRGFQVIVPDLPGFGQSQKPNFIWGLDEYSSFIDEFANKLNLSGLYLLGHSFGGALAVKYVLKYPNRAGKLFLVGAACIREKSFKKNIFKTLKIFKAIPLAKKFFYKFVVKSDYPQAEGIMRDIYLKVIKQDLTNELEKVNVPTIIVWGEKDSIVPLKFARIINTKVKNSRLVIIPQGNHDLERKMPEELAKEIC